MTFDQVMSLIPGDVPEDFDLDFKKELYGRGDSSKRDLCGDVAAMANTSGGLIILGLDENEHGNAAAAPLVALSDDEKRRMLQVIASGVSPLPHVAVLAVPGTNPDQGFYLLAVPRSPQAPHAVLVNDALRFPRRNGSTTTYLSQGEVRAAYFAQYGAERDRAAQLEAAETELLGSLDVAKQVFAVVTLLPDIPGGFAIDTAALRAFSERTRGKNPFLAGMAANWARTSVRPGRLVADGTSSTEGPSARVACHLHANGTGAFAGILGHADTEEETTGISDEALSDTIISGLHYLARHARDNAAASGNALLRATIYPMQKPAQLTHGRHFGREAMGNMISVITPSFTAAAIEDLADGGPELISAAYRMGSALAQAFGCAENLQFSPEGLLRRRYWHPSRVPQLERAVQNLGLSWTDQPV